MKKYQAHDLEEIPLRPGKLHTSPRVREAAYSQEMELCLPTRRPSGSRVRYCAKEALGTDKEPAGSGVPEGAHGGGGPSILGPWPGGLGRQGRECFWKRESRATGLGYEGSPVKGWDYPAAAVAWMVSTAVPGEVGAGLPPAATSETGRARREESSAPRRRRGAATGPRRGWGDATTPRRGRRGPAAAGWGWRAAATPWRGRRGPAAAMP